MQINNMMKTDGEDILIVDSDAFTRYGIRNYLQSLGYAVREADNVQSAWQMASKEPPQIVIVAACLPATPIERAVSPTEPHGIGLTVRLKQAFPTIGIVVLSAYHEYEQEVVRLAQKYMHSIVFLHKGGEVIRLAYALDQVKNGRNLFQHEIANKYVVETAVRAQFSANETYWIDQVLVELAELSPRETEVACLLSASHTADNIAEHLDLTKGSVDNVISRVYSKLGLSDMKMEAPALRPLPILVKACLLHHIRHNQ
jgi:DNA-binding NarL/FixJ family response regulator